MRNRTFGCFVSAALAAGVATNAKAAANAMRSRWHLILNLKCMGKILAKKSPFPVARFFTFRFGRRQNAGGSIAHCKSPGLNLGVFLSWTLVKQIASEFFSRGCQWLYLLHGKV